MRPWSNKICKKGLKFTHVIILKGLIYLFHRGDITPADGVVRKDNGVKGGQDVDMVGSAGVIDRIRR